MLILATDGPGAKAEGDRIILNIPSGKDSLQIALSLNQALLCSAELRRVVSNALDSGFAAANAEVIKMPSRRRKLRRGS